MVHSFYYPNNILNKYKDKFSLEDNENFQTFLKENSYDIIQESGAFDKEFYFNNYADVNTLDLDPIAHYLKYGVSENCNPNSIFDTKKYYESHKSDLNGLNPFVHYILYNNGSVISGLMNKLNKFKFSRKIFFNIMDAFEREVTIIIPIFNAYEDTKKCIESVLKNTTLKFKLILIDDKSTDLRISKLLDDYESFSNIQIIRNEINKGFTRNVNMGIKQDENDVVLLNSDTMVTPKWLQKIIINAYSDEDIGTLTPISNASDISVPVMNKNNEIPPFLDVDSMGSLVEKVSIADNLVSPTGNGFCLFIKRKTINDVGLFDEENFADGYGEETDFTLRTRNNGWKNVRNDSIFIYHKRSASFSLNKANSLKEKHKLILLNKYPNMFIDWGEFINSDELNNAVENISYHIDNFTDNLIKQNVLFITSLSGDYPKIDNIELLSDKFNLFILTIEHFKIKLWIVYDGSFILLNQFSFNSKYPDIDELNNYYLSLLIAFRIDCLFLLHNNSFKFLKNSPYILPIKLFSKIGLPISTGNISLELINPLVPSKNNRTILLNDIVNEKEKGVVYTALFGDYEELLDPKYITPGLDYVCFTDNPNLKSDVWDIKIIDNLELDDVRKARRIKILPHLYLKDYDYSIWVDAGFQIIGNIFDYINQYSNGKSMLGFIHSDRNCTYDEAIACINANKDDELLISNQISKYKNEGFPENYGLIETGVLFRKHNDVDVVNIMEEWYFEVINYSKRDQLSLPYVLWKNNFAMDKLRLFYWKNAYFEHFFHQKFNSNNLVLNNFRVIIIDDNSDLTNRSIEKLKNINENIPISVISSNDELHYMDSKYNFIEQINDLAISISEEFIILLHSGEYITDDLISYLDNNSLDALYDVGAIVFDSENYYSMDNFKNYKPNFSLDLYLEYDYIENALMINKNLLLSIGGFDTSFKKNFIRDIIFKFHDKGYKLLKEDIVGFKLNSFNKTDLCEDELLLKEYLSNHDVNADIVNENNIKPIYNTNNKKASIIIPFKDKSEVTEVCINSILNKTEYSNYEIILVNNNSYEDKTINFINNIKNHEKIRVIDYNEEFNYSKLNNFATNYANGDVFVFLNNDTEILSGNWLDLLIGDAIQDNVGAVGAKLYYPDMTIQHIGVVIGLNGLAGHLFAGENENNIPNQVIKYRRNVTAVTGACMAIEKKVFQEIDGFNELFDITGSDVEICLKLLENGYRNVINPNIQLIHHEKKTRSKIKVRDIDIQLSIEYYGPYLDDGDPFFNKNFSLNSNKLLLKEIDEVPVYKNFLDNYYKNKSNRVNKINNIINSRKQIKDISMDAEVLAYDVTPYELNDNAILMNKFFKNPFLKLNRVLWFVPWFDHILRGGIYTIFRLANHFSIKEDTQNIFVLKGGGRRDLEDLSEEIIKEFPNLKFDLIDLDLFGDISKLPESDAAFCTLWTTAYSLVKYNNCKAKFYLNQDYEPLFVAAGSVYGLIEETYRFNFIGVANTKGVMDKYENYGNVVKYFTPAIDKRIYFPNSSKNSKKSVVFYGRPDKSRNGFILGIEALKIVKDYFGDNVEIFSAGAEFDLGKYGLENTLTNLGLLDSADKVADLYRKCDVGLVFMFTPHPSYQPLEYMACGCATVSNINEGNSWLLKDKENAILSEPLISCVAENIINLLLDDNLRENIIQNGFKTIEKINWNDEMDNVLNFVKNPLNKKL